MILGQCVPHPYLGHCPQILLFLIMTPPLNKIADICMQKIFHDNSKTWKENLILAEPPRDYNIPL